MYEGETEDELIFRLGSEKDKIGTWQDVANIINDLTGNDFGESTYRKKFQSFMKLLSANQSKFADSQAQLEEIKNQMIELRKERIKLSDARVEYNRLIRQEARKESFVDMVKRIISENVAPVEFIEKDFSFHSNNDLLCHFTDIHTGIEIDNFKNEFNTDVLRERVGKYLNEILNIAEINNSENCYLVIGEILSGLIHNNLRLQNNLDLIEQFKFVAELISSMTITLSERFNSVFVYVTPGNHSRVVAKKEDSLDGENMDILLPFYLKAKLQNSKNVFIEENSIDTEIAIFNIRGNKVYATHGHKDSVSNVVQNFTLMFGEKPDIVLLGHRHTNGLTTVYDTKVIESGCVSGTDQYALSIRKTNKPEQTVSVINKDGLFCVYDIQL